MPQNYCIVVQYEGTHYWGWQIQKGQPTIQQKLEEAIALVIQQKVNVVGSGRTDTGVHALGQVAHFLAETKIPPERLITGINFYLPKDIVVQELKRVPLDFHARYQAKRKEYAYHIWNHLQPSPLHRHFSTWIRFPLCVEKMQLAANYLVGTHDFSAFASRKDPNKSGVRTVFRADWRREGPKLIFEIEGSGFLYNMVRTIIGTLLEVGAEKKSPEMFAEVLRSKSRTTAGMKAPPEGLCLVQVLY